VSAASCACSCFLASTAFFSISRACSFDWLTSLCACIRQHTSAYVSVHHLLRLLLGLAHLAPRLHTSAYVSIRQHTSAYVSIRQHTSASVSIRQHTSAYVISRSCSCGLAHLTPRPLRLLPRDFHLSPRLLSRRRRRLLRLLHLLLRNRIKALLGRYEGTYDGAITALWQRC